MAEIYTNFNGCFLNLFMETYEERFFIGSLESERNSGFVNRTRFPLLCEKCGAILLVLVGLTAGSPAVRRNSGRFRNFQISLLIVLLGFQWSLTKVQFCYSVTNGF